MVSRFTRYILIQAVILLSASSLAVAQSSNDRQSEASKTPVQQDQEIESGPGLIKPLTPTRNFSLKASFERADKDNKEITVAKKNLPIAAAAIKIAGAIPNPQFQLQTGFGPSFYELFTGQTQQIGWTEQFQTAGKRTKKIELAKANYFLAKLQVDALRFDVHNRVRRAYAELTAAEAYDALIEAQKRVGLRLLEIAQKRVEAGKAAPTEVMQARLNVMQFDTLANQAQGRLQQASAALTLISGERPTKVEVIDADDCGLFRLSAEHTDIVPSPLKLLPSLDTLLETAYNSRPDLRTALQQITVNRKALSLAKAQRIPDLFIGSGYTFSTFAKHQPSQLLPQPNWLGNGVFLNVTAEVPVLYTHKGEVLQALATLRQSERQLELLKSVIATDLVVAYNEVEVAKQNIALYQDSLLPTAAEAARIARRGYRFGATDLATAIVAQQQYQQTLSGYFDVVSAYQTAWADLEKAVGLALNL